MISKTKKSITFRQHKKVPKRLSKKNTQTQLLIVICMRCLKLITCWRKFFGASYVSDFERVVIVTFLGCEF